MSAGAVAFTVITLGWFFVLAAFVATPFALLAGAMAAFGHGAAGTDGRPMVTSILGIPVLAIVIGVFIMVLGFFISFWMLKSAQIHRPFAVTWRALGISIGFWNVVVLIWVLVTNVAAADAIEQLSFVWTVGLAAVLMLIAAAGVGYFVWWWMAYCLRARHPAQRHAGDSYDV